jgi:hypothetical protein
MLPAAEATRVADEAFAGCRGSAGFVQLRPRRWIRTSKAPIHELIELHSHRIGYSMDWGIGATFVPFIDSDDGQSWEFKRKRTEKTSRIDVGLGPRLRNFPDAPRFAAAKYEIVEPVHESLSGLFKRRIPLPNKPHFLADEPGIRAIVKNGCEAALRDFETIRIPRHVLNLLSSGYEASLLAPPEKIPAYWLTRGIYEIACGNDDRGRTFLDQAYKTFGFDPADPILQESIELARSHSREKAA